MKLFKTEMPGVVRLLEQVRIYLRGARTTNYTRAAADHGPWVWTRRRWWTSLVRRSPAPWRSRRPRGAAVTLVWSWLLTLLARHGTRSYFVTQRPSDPGIQGPGDPVDPVTLFYNELQMSTYVADKRLQLARSLPVFIAVWRLLASGK